jgi:hypothetical protein
MWMGLYGVSTRAFNQAVKRHLDRDRLRKSAKRTGAKGPGHGVVAFGLTSRLQGF